MDSPKASYLLTHASMPRLTGLLMGILLLSLPVNAQQTQPDGSDGPPGEESYMAKCAMCHIGGRGIPINLMAKLSPELVYQAISTGPMRAFVDGLSTQERENIAEYITGSKVGHAPTPTGVGSCKSGPNWFQYSELPSASGWGITNNDNTRFIPGDVANLTKAQVKRLKLKWAFAFPDTLAARAQPAIAGGAVFVGDQFGNVFALDAKTGCVHWNFKADTFVRTAISINRWSKDGPSDADRVPTIYFGDQVAQTYAVNAVTGKLIWKTLVDDDPLAVHTGSPTLVQSSDGNRLYVPVSYPVLDGLSSTDLVCCRSRGSVSALDADTGAVIWKSYAIPTAPRQRGVNADGRPLFGPSGAGVWSSPTIDEKRGRLYVGTGENTTGPEENGGAVIAMNLKDGSIAWVMQLYPLESYNESCFKWGVNCPANFKGRHALDVSASPMLVQDHDGNDVVVAAQKTGDVVGLDPDADGKIIWRRRIVRGDADSGVVFGMASEGTHVFAPSAADYICDREKGPTWGSDVLGIYAMDGISGEPLWKAPFQNVDQQTASGTKSACDGYRAAVTAIPDVVFAGTISGWLRAFNSEDGKMIWEFNTAREFEAVNGGVAKGGSMSGPGPVIANGMVFVHSGYWRGNAFLAFSVDGK